MGYTAPPSPKQLANSWVNCRCDYCGNRTGGLSNFVKTCPGCGAPRSLFSFGSPAPPLPHESGDAYRRRTGVSTPVNPTASIKW